MDYAQITLVPGASQSCEETVASSLESTRFDRDYDSTLWLFLLLVVSVVQC